MHDSVLTDPAVIQVSIDVTSVEEALAIARMAIRAGVDWLEVGTPLIMALGLASVRPIAEAFPDYPIFADAKLVDGTRKYVVAAALGGATMTSVCGTASDASIREAAAGARETGTQIVVDLYACPEPVQRAREVVDLGADLVYLHYGGDQRAADPDGDETLKLLPQLCTAVDVPIGVVTFDAEGAALAVESGADIVLIGHPYLNGPRSEEMLEHFVRTVRAVERPNRARRPRRAV